jgi:adenosylmethionine-8-amino-7-oxononanoate aminotransferase
MSDTPRLLALDHAHLWHPFTPMRQWREQPQLVIDRAQGFELIDTEGRRYIDGVSSLWCNVHGHRVPQIDAAIRAQLDRVAHSTLLGLASTPSIELAAALVNLCRDTLQPGSPQVIAGLHSRPLNKVFYSDAGATALEVAFKMAVGYWHHRGRPAKRQLIGLAGAYHGDTVGSMSVGFSELFHRPFTSMLFPVTWMPSPDVPRLMHLLPGAEKCSGWPSQDAALAEAASRHCLQHLRQMLEEKADDTAAIVIEPVMQGAAGMVCQPPGFLHGVAQLARQFNVLLIADEVATGFGRTGAMFACQHERVCPDILCLAKGITGGYLPLAATLATDEIEDAFTGELAQARTLYHGHTYTGNALGCAAAMASLDLFHQHDVVSHAAAMAQHLAQRLQPLRRHEHVLDVRQRGLMVGIELCQRRPQAGQPAQPFDFARRTAAGLCLAMRPRGLIIRPLGDVLVLMPAPAMDQATLDRMLDIVLDTLSDWRPA